MTDNQLARQQEAWRKLALAKEEINKGATVKQALKNTGLSISFWYGHRNMTEPGKEQPGVTATPARKALPPPAPKPAPAPSPLNYCPGCGMNLRAVNIALRIAHE